MIRAVRSTYRVQLSPTFGFADARAIVGHVADLGISHVYTSPVLEATPGSTHGYDVTDHSRVRADFGGEEGLREFVDELRRHDMGWVVDLVPNHVSVTVPRANPRWWDMLRYGPASQSAPWFDVDWEAGDGRVILPTLGAPLADEIEAGTVSVRRSESDEDLVLAYHDLVLPIRPGTATADDIGAAPERIALIVSAQHYRPAFWRDAERNYRVFFDIDSLAAVRIEDPAVFNAVHDRLRQHVADDLVDGVRVDHVDGLADPAGYLDDLRDLLGPDRPIWVEKITMADETIPSTWPVAGATGYGFARIATALAVEPTAEDHFDAAWHGWSSDDRDYDEHEHDAKREVLAGGLSHDLERLVRVTCEALDRPADRVRPALVELIVATPVYRTYGTGTAPLTGADAEPLDVAVEAARTRRPDLAPAIDAITELVRRPDPSGVEVRRRLQQLSGPAMAKGAEDTASYRYLRFVALNEVGGDPSRFGAHPDEYHQHQQTAAVARPPGPMLAASTHDTKRSADVRARLAVLSHDPERWDRFLDEVTTLTAADRPARLDRATELLLWQTVVGAWPITEERLAAYLTKAVREAKTHTTWTESNTAYENDVVSYAAHVVRDDAVQAAISRLVEWLGPAGRAVRLEELVLRFTAIGVPDIYQGDQDWDLSLVDPDNRRPVDHPRLAQRLAAALELPDVDACGLAEDSPAKLWVTSKLLSLRAAHPDWFAPGSGHEVLSTGGVPASVVAMRHGGALAILGTGAPSDEQRGAAVELPAGEWVDLLRPGRPAISGSVVAGEIWSDTRAAVLVAAEQR